MVITIRVTENQKQLIEDYAKCQGLSISEVMKKAIFHEIQDEYDIREAEAAIAECEESGITYTHEEMKKRLGLEQDI